MASSFEQSTTKTPKKQKIRTVIRNAKEQEWANISVIPDKGELVYASDVNTLKIGDGVTVYDNLPAISGGQGCTSDYVDLTNKPEINGVTLVGNVSLSSLGLSNVASTGEYADLINKPTLGTMAAENAGDYTKTSSLSNVALTGSYDDLVNKPSFGTAAFANTTDFATAAQGDLANTAVQPIDLANVATTGNYNDLTNKPTIPAAQVNADWNATSGVAEILNKPNLANVAISGDYNDLTNTPAFGTAAFANTTDFATAAEGNLATTAVQPGDLATVATTGSYEDLTNKPYIPSGVVVDLTYDPLSVNAQAGTAVAEAVANKQDTLINGTNIKSINGNSLLGSGDLELDGLPSQSGQSGKFLTTNGTDASWSSLANVAISGEYNDLLNTPVIPAAQVQTDWNVTSGMGVLLNKPTLTNVALTGDYNDLINKPVLGSAAYADAGDFASAEEGSLAATAVQPGDLADVATTGEYSDLINAPTLATVATTGEYSDLLNTPTIPAPQVQADWDQTNTSAVDYIKNKPYIPSGVTVDQTYNASSTNAQAGLAVAEAIATKSVVVLREW